MPVMLKTTPSKRAIASPASTASTTGSAESNEMRAMTHCMEIEGMICSGAVLLLWSADGFKERVQG